MMSAGAPCPAMACNLVRAAGCPASPLHARGRGTTIGADLIDIAAPPPARPAAARSCTCHT
jgi:hypothetical protein